MVGIVIVSHSQKIAEGAKELAHQMAPDAQIAAAGGMQNGEIGTDVAKITDAIQSVLSDDGVVVVVDLGSAIMSSEMAIEMIPDNEKIIIVDSPIIEGTIFGAVESTIGSPLEKVIEVLHEAKSYKKF